MSHLDKLDKTVISSTPIGAVYNDLGRLGRWLLYSPT
jgi:hypothetical protein